MHFKRICLMSMYDLIGEFIEYAILVFIFFFLYIYLYITSMRALWKSLYTVLTGVEEPAGQSCP